MLNNEISNTLGALVTILKSALMSLVGMGSSWIVSVVYDQSLLVMMIIWAICETISNIFVRPIVDLALKIRIEAKHSADEINIK